MALTVIEYSEIRDELLTGDLVLMQGLNIDSEIIKVVEQSPWSHVAMIIRIRGIDPPLLWESTPLHFLEDKILHAKKSGARIVSLDDRLRIGRMKKLYKVFALRRLKVRRTRFMMDSLRNYIENVHLLPYPTDWELVKSYLKGKLLGERESSSSLFCAELIAETYMHMGLLAFDHPPNWYSPKDFSSEVQLPFLKKARLQKEIVIVDE
ncbi:MAG: hypothetical protein EG822_09055 [Deltaproteobacteria bacterium]|nr:hypothetical protein [Deltaproteobacteria bacterium]TLN03899.1 MAG: hypothetical protein FDZ73_05990 [bacterium]